MAYLNKLGSRANMTGSTDVLANSVSIIRNGQVVDITSVLGSGSGSTGAAHWSCREKGNRSWHGAASVHLRRCQDGCNSRTGRESKRNEPAPGWAGILGAAAPSPPRSRAAGPRVSTSQFSGDGLQLVSSALVPFFAWRVSRLWAMNPASVKIRAQRSASAT